MRFIKIVISILILMLPLQVFAADNIRKITVSGKSEISLDAHYAIIHLVIKHIDEEMDQSRFELTKTISKLSEGLMAIGLKSEDIKKSLILQGSEYSWEHSSRVHNGFYSKCELDLHVNDIGNISGIYEELSNYKSITIFGTDYKRNDEFDVREKEFEKALHAAKRKAEHMAQTLNMKIGKVCSIQELSSENRYTGSAYSNVSQEIPNEYNNGFGRTKISAQVLVEFELE